jgi:ABC-type Zn uptake system ZnuABC Zn-binding protein ZnuA
MSLSPGFGYLIASLNLDAVEPPDTVPAGEWTQESLGQLKTLMLDNDVRLVLSDRPADETLAAAIKDAGGRLLVVNNESEDAMEALEAIVEQVISALSLLQDEG